MSLWDRISHLFRGSPPPHDPVKATLTERQVHVADQLARMRGQTRDEVLNEAYRRADRILAGKHK